MRTRRHVLLIAVPVVCALGLGSNAQASRDTTCTQWQLDAPHPVADGGIESAECTCLSWNSYGDPAPPRYTCDLCAQSSAIGALCIQRGADLPAAAGQGCSQAGGWAASCLLALVPGFLLLRRRRVP